MTDPSYRVFIEEGALEVLEGIRGLTRSRLRQFIQNLGNDPFEEGDFTETDAAGRRSFCKIIKGYALSYYPDHAVKEVKVFEISRAGR